MAIKKKTINVFALLLSIFLLCSCSHKPGVKQLPHYPQKREVNTVVKQPAPELKRMGYTVQVGAFSNIDNAIRLTKTLEKHGLDAFYFRHTTGIYRVRFGNYITISEAKDAAQKLVSSGIVESFHIVAPGEYVQPVKPAPGMKTVEITGDTMRDHIAATASGFIGLPYQWGDISPTKGFDCSSLVMAVFQLNGLVVPRTSADQFKSGVPVDPMKLERGDLVFFTTNGTGQVSHVGIYIGEGIFIHAPGKGKPIREESLNTQYYRDRFMGACTYLD
jgi:hypothetical protein